MARQLTMLHLKKSFSLIICLSALFLSACSGNVKEKIGLDTGSPDEFQVIKRAPLDIPPELARLSNEPVALPKPRPGAPRPQELSAENEAKAAILGQEIARPKTTQDVSETEAALLEKLGSAPKNERESQAFRDSVDREYDEWAEDNRPVIEKLGIVDNYTARKQALDPSEEAAKLRAQKLNTPNRSQKRIIAPVTGTPESTVESEDLSEDMDNEIANNDNAAKALLDNIEDDEAEAPLNQDTEAKEILDEAVSENQNDMAADDSKTERFMIGDDQIELLEDDQTPSRRGSDEAPAEEERFFEEPMTPVTKTQNTPSPTAQQTGDSPVVEDEPLIRSYSTLEDILNNAPATVPDTE